MVDSKNWSGVVVVKNGVLRQDGRSREKAVVGAAEGALAVGGLLPALDPRLVQPVLCFVRDAEVSGWARDVMVCSTTTLVRMLLSRPVVLDSSSRSVLTLDLDAQFRAAAQLERPRHAAKAKSSASKAAIRRRKRSSPAAALVPLMAIIVLWWVLSKYPGILNGLAEWLTGCLTK